MSSLSKKQQSLIKSLYTRHGRKKFGMCICEGLRSCGELFMLCPERVEFVVCTENAVSQLNGQEMPDPTFIVTNEELKKLTGTVSSQGIIAVTKRPDYTDGDQAPVDPFLFVLDRVADPGNFGTILRTAKAIGLQEMWFTKGSCDPYNDKVIRSAMAAQFGMILREFDDLDCLAESLRAHGYNDIYRTTPHEGESCFTAPKLFEKSAIIIGNEANGAAELDGSLSLTIPMPGNYESINAAQAATVILFEYVRRNS